MEKIDYLETKVNEILTEISFLTERCDELEAKINGTETTSLQNNLDSSATTK